MEKILSSGSCRIKRQGSVHGTSKEEAVLFYQNAILWHLLDVLNTVRSLTKKIIT
jgi:hypothetical protein